MKIRGNNQYIGPFERIGRAVLRQSRNSPIPHDIRSEFLKLPFRDQAELIGWYARIQLRSADKILHNKLRYASGETPKAIDYWKKMMERAVRIGSEKLYEQSDPKTNKVPRQELKDVMKPIVRLFRESYEYWDKNFYSYDIHGNQNFLTCQHSRARALAYRDKQKIDKISGMPGLGWSIMNFADILYFNTILPPFAKN
jgi:hypothetical protein